MERPKPCTCLNGPCEGECGYDPAAWDAYEAGQALANGLASGIVVDPHVLVNGNDVTITWRAE